MKKFLRFVFILLLIALVAAGGLFAFFIYDYHHASESAQMALVSTSTVTVNEVDDKITAFVPESPKGGVIFYPGGKVEVEAYAPLMQEIAERGFVSVYVEMPANLAFLDKNAADGIRELYPEITDWYMAGHSLGGTMAASYVADHTDAFKGLILMGSYALDDISLSGLTVCSLYGSEDGVLNMDRYNENRTNLPYYIIEKEIPGGCHSYFGDYGIQEGDGIPSISMEEQIKITADFVSYISQL